MLNACTQQKEDIIQESGIGETVIQIEQSDSEDPNELLSKLSVSTEHMIDINIAGNSLLYDYLQSPQSFEKKYDLDKLFVMGIRTSDISETECIRFSDNYSDEIIELIKLGDSMESVIERLGEPQFSDAELDYIGYRTNECYFAVEGDTSVESIVFTKNYELPVGYENIIKDYIESGYSYLDQYPDYSFRGQHARGGQSVIYPFGVEFHSYSDNKIYVYTNFDGDIPVSENIVYVMRDSNEVMLRRHFYRNKMYKNDETLISPDGKKEAFECTMIALYEYNKIYIYSLDNSFAPRVFFPGYWIGKDMYWLDNDVLLFAGNDTLGAYSLKSDKVYYIADAFDITILNINTEEHRVEGDAEGMWFILDYELSDEFSYEISWIEDYTSELQETGSDKETLKYETCDSTAYDFVCSSFSDGMFRTGTGQ